MEALREPGMIHVKAMCVIARDGTMLATKGFDEVKGEKFVTGLVVKNRRTGETTEIPVTGVFVAIGHAPASELVKDQLPLHNGGYVKVEPGSTRTAAWGARGEAVTVQRHGKKATGRRLDGRTHDTLTHAKAHVGQRRLRIPDGVCDAQLLPLLVEQIDVHQPG